MHGTHVPVEEPSTASQADVRKPKHGLIHSRATSHMPMALWASSMCFMHPAVSPFFIAALDMSRAVIASFILAASVILAIIIHLFHVSIIAEILGGIRRTDS